MRYVNKATAWNSAEIVPAMYLPPYKESKILLRSSLRRLLLQAQRSDLSLREAGTLEILSGILGRTHRDLQLGLVLIKRGGLAIVLLTCGALLPVGFSLSSPTLSLLSCVSASRCLKFGCHVSSATISLTSLAFIGLHLIHSFTVILAGFQEVAAFTWKPRVHSRLARDRQSTSLVPRFLAACLSRVNFTHPLRQGASLLILPSLPELAHGPGSPQVQRTHFPN